MRCAPHVSAAAQSHVRAPSPSRLRRGGRGPAGAAPAGSGGRGVAGGACPRSWAGPAPLPAGSRTDGGLGSGWRSPDAAGGGGGLKGPSSPAAPHPGSPAGKGRVRPGPEQLPPPRAIALPGTVPRWGRGRRHP